MINKLGIKNLWERKVTQITPSYTVVNQFRNEHLTDVVSIVLVSLELISKYIILIVHGINCHCDY